MNYEIRCLNFGGVTIDASMQVRGRSPGHRISVPAQGFLVLGGPAPILVDAGFRDVSVLGSGGQVSEGQGFHEQLAVHGVRVDDLGCVVMTHLHRDHAGHLDKVPMRVPVVINRSELAGACSGIQGLAYAQQDLHHLLDRMYTPGAMRLLDLEWSGGIELFPGISCRITGGHTPGSISLIVQTHDGEACLCGDLLYDVQGSLANPPRTGHLAGVQACALGDHEPGLTNNFTTSVLQEIGAIKRILRYRYIMPCHDDPGVLQDGELIGRIRGGIVPGPVTALDPVGQDDSALLARETKDFGRAGV